MGTGVLGVKEPRMLRAGINRFRIFLVYRHAGQRPIAQVALGLRELPAVQLESVPAGKSRDMQRLLAVDFAHAGLLIFAAFLVLMLLLACSWRGPQRLFI